MQWVQTWKKKNIKVGETRKLAHSNISGTELEPPRGEGAVPIPKRAARRERGKPQSGSGGARLLPALLVREDGQAPFEANGRESKGQTTGKADGRADIGADIQIAQAQKHQADGERDAGV